MLCIYNTSIEPYINMATEEHLFKNFQDDIFMLWRNNNAIVVGKHQNTLAEINLEHVRQNDIKVVRRLSGGGAVFHDLGNLNFTFIVNGEDSSLVDFRKYTQPILDVLQSLGVNAIFEGRNDLTIEGKKFSGNAVHVIRNRVLQHGTLLFTSQISDLTEALKVNPLKFQDKAVKSVRSRVTNISEHLPHPIALDQFTQLIMKHIQSMYADATMYEFNSEDNEAIQKLADEKYSTWDWNFGYQAKYNFEKLERTSAGNIEVHLNVENGFIKECKIYGDYFNTAETSDIEVALIGVKHEYNVISTLLNQFDLDSYFRGIAKGEIEKCFF